MRACPPEWQALAPSPSLLAWSPVKVLLSTVREPVFSIAPPLPDAVLLLKVEVLTVRAPWLLLIAAPEGPLFCVKVHDRRATVPEMWRCPSSEADVTRETSPTRQ
jgi:hypothetical protein